MQSIRYLLTRLGVMAAHPGAFGILIVYALLWLIFDRDSFDWHASATLIVWFMTLLIQRAEHRDTQALQAKLDELLHAQRGADSALATTKSRRTSSAIGLELGGRISPSSGACSRRISCERLKNTSFCRPVKSEMECSARNARPYRGVE